MDLAICIIVGELSRQATVRVLLLCIVMLMSAPSSASEREAVLRLLDGYEWQVNEAAFRQLPEDTWQVLLEIATDMDLMKLTRSRASAALTLYPNDAVWAYFSRAITEPETPVQRRRAVEALCQAFRVEERPAMETLLVPMLEASDAHLRTKVASCLQSVNSERALQALARYRERIEEDWEVRAAGFGKK